MLSDSVEVLDDTGADVGADVGTDVCTDVGTDVGTATAVLVVVSVLVSVVVCVRVCVVAVFVVAADADVLVVGSAVAVRDVLTASPPEEAGEERSTLVGRVCEPVTDLDGVAEPPAEPPPAEQPASRTPISASAVGAIMSASGRWRSPSGGGGIVPLLS